MSESNETEAVLREVQAERAKQDFKWGLQKHPDGTGSVAQQVAAYWAKKTCEDHFAEGEGTWSDVLMEEVTEARAEADGEPLRAELVQVAAVAVAWIEALDRRGAK